MLALLLLLNAPARSSATVRTRDLTTLTLDRARE